MDLLTVTRPAEENILGIAFSRSPEEQLDVWRTHVGSDFPAETVLVTVGTQDSSADFTELSTARFDSNELPDTSISIRTVSSPTDVTGLGMELSEIVEGWAETNKQPVVCFRSLTTLLQYADLETTFRFLHIMTGRFTSIDAIAHYHLNPNAHDDQEIRTLTQLADSIVKFDDQAGWDVTTA